MDKVVLAQDMKKHVDNLEHSRESLLEKMILPDTKTHFETMENH